jgi:outer membrane lipoprotein LolB
LIRHFTICLAVLMLASCSQSSLVSDQATVEQAWQFRQQALQAVNRWDIQARAVVKLEGAAYNLGIRWQQESGQFIILLQAPFGQGVIRIESISDDNYRLDLPDGRVLHANTPEALLEQVIGWSIPIGGLKYWIRGLPQPHGKFSHRFDAAGRTRFLKQNDWSIDYIDYFKPPDSTHTTELPRRLKLTRDQILIKIVIERWQALETDEPPSDLFPEFN